MVPGCGPGSGQGRRQGCGHGSGKAKKGKKQQKGSKEEKKALVAAEDGAASSMVKEAAEPAPERQMTRIKSKLEVEEDEKNQDCFTTFFEFLPQPRKVGARTCLHLCLFGSVVAYVVQLTLTAGASMYGVLLYGVSTQAISSTVRVNMHIAASLDA